MPSQAHKKPRDFLELQTSCLLVQDLAMTQGCLWLQTWWLLLSGPETDYFFPLKIMVFRGVGFNCCIWQVSFIAFSSNDLLTDRKGNIGMLTAYSNPPTLSPLQG